MRKASMLVGAVIVGLLAQAVAQTTSENRKPFSTWSIHTPEMNVAQRTVYLVGVLTPAKPIVVRRIEAISNRGPVEISRNTIEPVTCPVRYTLEITSGLVTQTVPISNVFLSKGSSQTYTDSGLLNLSFSAGNRVTLSLVFPKAQFPPVTCALSGLNVTVQYDLAEDSDKQETSEATPH